MKSSISKQYFIFFLLCIGLTACVSSTPYEISSHHPDHSISPTEQNCKNTNIFKFENHDLTHGEQLDPNRISILNWNIYKGSRDSWENDFKLLSQNRDILIMQEARLDETLHHMLDENRFHWDLTSAFRYRDSRVGVMTASKIRPVALCSVHSNEPFVRLPKTMLISLYQLADRSDTLLVANIHSINFTLGTESYSEQLQSLQDILQQHTGPMIIAGDFNSWSDGRMHFIEQLEQNLSLNSLQYKSHNRTKIFGKAIDHIFYRDLTPYELTTPQVISSDHNPILVSFSVNISNQQR